MTGRAGEADRAERTRRAEIPGAVDRAVVERQLGRPPRGDWRVAVRCPDGRPMVILVPPALNGGVPFPTALWLTCPRLSRAVADSESMGGSARWAGALRTDPRLAGRALAADAAYRALRASIASGPDPCAEVGIAGQADPLAVKCLHARVAAALYGIDDPVGVGVLAEVGESGTAAPGCRESGCASTDAPAG